MEKIILLIFTVFLAFTLHFSSALSLSKNKDEYITTEEKEKIKNGNKQLSSVFWFGPRVGRRKRNPTESVFKNLDRDDMEVLLESIRNDPWTVLPFNNGRRNTMGFTPRLGRESGEEMEDAVFGDFVSQRSPPFAPRLGRHLSPYSPSLGRENGILLEQ